MPRPAPTRSRALSAIFQQAADQERISASQTPLIAIVVASFLDRIGFVECIDSMLTWDPTQWRVSPGNLAKAIVLLPFIYAGPRLPIYSIFEHYQQMDMDLLFTPEVRAEWLTRDAISCLLDRFFAAGCERLFTPLALRVYTAFSIPFHPVVHGDTTSLSLYGAYEGEADESPAAPTICPGYSKDGNRDLVQVMLGQVCDPFGIPLITTVRDGNEADCTWNTAVIQTLAELNPFAQTGVTYIADAKLATAPNLRKLLDHNFQFVTRRPASFSKKVAAAVTRAAYEANAWLPIGSYREEQGTTLETYEVQEFTRVVEGGARCRLLVFRSSHRRKEFETKLQTTLQEVASALAEVTKKRFACETDAQRAMEEAQKNLRTHRFWTADLTLATVVTEKNPRGRPGKNPGPKNLVTEWVIRAGTPQRNEEVYLAELRKAESFVLMTNVPVERAPAREVLRPYKEQKTVEDNFSVIKRPMMVDTLYLKKPTRIAALVTLLAFSLLIQVVIRVLVRRNLDVMETPPDLDHGCKPLVRPGLKKILRFLGYHFIITSGGERRFWCIAKDHEKNLTIWLRLLEFELDR
ncbi:IS1634 family transposase ISTth3 [subsurface metagenome]